VLCSDPDVRPQRHWVSYCLDAMVAACDVARNPQQKTVAIIDLTGAGYANMDVAGSNEMFKLLNTHYVERLGCLYFFNAPMIFHGLWNGLKVRPHSRAPVQGRATPCLASPRPAPRLRPAPDTHSHACPMPGLDPAPAMAAPAGHAA